MRVCRLHDTEQLCATVRGRAGWAWNRVLFCGTAGAAFANVQAAAGAFPFGPFRYFIAIRHLRRPEHDPDHSAQAFGVH
jgi:hypothetical protein